MTMALKRCLAVGCTIFALNLPITSYAQNSHAASSSTTAHSNSNSHSRSGSHTKSRNLGKPAFLDDDDQTGGDPMGAGWGQGCSYVCEGNYDDMLDTWDDFSTWIYSTLNASFIDTKSELKDIIDDASTMMLTKVHQKAAAISHHQARLEATHRVLVDIIGSDDEDDVPVVSREMLASSEPTDVHIGTGVLWSTFGMQMLVALTVGVVIESYRIRRQHSAQDAFGDQLDMKRNYA
mmetsp:Transcript_51386/g.65784  ORF Transcript_51386/g.65784 Transcript_51386/m.65784 type:complete len:235 (-) Transcript_51386:4-708(-)|eukprot:CAMPEP_0114342044 /NCGR_PEP_ID=MMETSP0101-20121206/9504_1 /TAXON_ID=38822 ORGANISM="Pteridomonas danica, Strain PT" /NCGR_SAMPLE_ID=MMETSP0101 /ASSEMBLY_ACC=CAM_ASM_000211 /LENGTH=234 /DNA_ID=CAMNT_0001475955 /DNA_START=20 /DNA_END=724 /DNA_ORIENTATION=+